MEYIIYILAGVFLLFILYAVIMFVIAFNKK